MWDEMKVVMNKLEKEREERQMEMNSDTTEQCATALFALFPFHQLSLLPKSTLAGGDSESQPSCCSGGIPSKQPLSATGGFVFFILI